MNETDKALMAGELDEFMIDDDVEFADEDVSGAVVKGGVVSVKGTQKDRKDRKEKDKGKGKSKDKGKDKGKKRGGDDRKAKRARP